MLNYVWLSFWEFHPLFKTPKSSSRVTSGRDGGEGNWTENRFHPKAHRDKHSNFETSKETWTKEEKLEKQRRPENPFLSKQPQRRTEMEKGLRLQLGENKEDKWGTGWETRRIILIMCPHTHPEARTARERERERKKKTKARAQVGGWRVRAQVGENKGYKHGDRRSQSHQNKHRAIFVAINVCPIPSSLPTKPYGLCGCLNWRTPKPTQFESSNWWISGNDKKCGSS